MSVHNKHLDEPWYSLVLLGIKTVEGRINDERVSNIKIGDSIVFINNELGYERSCRVKITCIVNYDSLQSYLENETIANCLPGVDNMNNALRIYYSYFTTNDEIEYGIKALSLNIN